MCWYLILSCPIWIVLVFILCSSWKCAEILDSPYSKCRSNCTAQLFQWLALTKLWFHFCSCKSGSCICLTNCGCRLSWIDCEVFLSNHTSVVMKSHFTILVKETHSAELFTGVRIVYLGQEDSWAVDSGEDSAVFLQVQVQNRSEGCLQDISTLLDLQYPSNPTISSLVLCTVLAWHLSLIQKLFVWIWLLLPFILAGQMLRCCSLSFSYYQRFSASVERDSRKGCVTLSRPPLFTAQHVYWQTTIYWQTLSKKRAAEVQKYTLISSSHNVGGSLLQRKQILALSVMKKFSEI